MSKVQVACFGEVLWDVFPTRKVIGGAPLNVALRLQSLGVDVAVISRIGDDDNGDKALNYFIDNEIIGSFVQKDKVLETGHVIVTLDDKGSASYEVSKPVAWDNIQVNQANLELVSNSQVFVFGSLACRENATKETLLKLIEKANYKIFDVNLRPPDYTVSLIIQLAQKADFIKMNDEELVQICTDIGSYAPTIEEQIQFISKETNTNTLCITKGSDGAVLFQNDKFYKNKGYKVIVEDTVGAGDSFLASLITKLLLENEEPQAAIDFACAVGSLVASKKGANPKITSEEIKVVLES